MSNKDLDELSDSLLSNSESGIECSICLDNLENDDIAYMDCGHSYHFRCIGSWMHHKKYHEIPCPLCNNIDSNIIDVKKGKKMKNNIEIIEENFESNEIDNNEIENIDLNKKNMGIIGYICGCFYIKR